MKLTSTYVAIGLVLGSGAALAGAGAPGHSHDTNSFGRPGDPRKPSRIVEIAMKEGDGTMHFAPREVRVRKGEQIRFKLRNHGELDHELVLATLAANLKHAEEMRKNPDMEHDDPNAKRLAPKKTAELIWQFDKSGVFDFSCLIPGHREAGMTGQVIVE